MKKCGRPPKDASDADSRQIIIDAAINLIRSEGAASITVRNICEKSNLSTGTFYHCFKNKDELLMQFIKDGLFFDEDFGKTISEPVEYVAALYMQLISEYRKLGISFMKNFYSCSNTALSAYMGQTNQSFSPNTIMYVCEQQLKKFQEEGKIHADEDVHEISEDICTIVKGCVFEWCICDGEMDIEKTLRRILGRYFSNIYQKADNKLV